MRFQSVLGLLMILALAACGGAPAGPTSTDGGFSGPIVWDRSPETIVFRADVVGGSDADLLPALSEIPPCTVYGDNRVVWTNELGTYDTQVLWDKVTDEQIQNFITYLTINKQIYSSQSRGELQPPGSAQPVVETLTVFVNGVEHRTDAFAGWDFDYYQDILNQCRSISQTPVLYEPEAAWLTAQAVSYDSNAPLVPWDGTASGLDLAELAAAGEPRWISGPNLRILWNIVRTSPPRVQLIQDGVPYFIALQVPGVTRQSPPAPAAAG